MKIVMPRGDYRGIKFELCNKNTDNSIEEIIFDDIFITFKKYTSSKNMLFQKRLSNGDITKDEDGYYHFGIFPEDTEKLEYGQYYFDIEVYKENPIIKQTFLGILELTPEVTFKENEV